LTAKYLVIFDFTAVGYPLQMVPLVKNSCETLAEKLGEYAESGKSLDVFRYNILFYNWF